MFRALYTAASGMTAQQLNLDNIANNLANSSTTGFQQRQVNFTDLLYQNEIMPGAAATQQTIQGAGFFQILMPNGQIGYTRDGSFHPDAQGALVTSDGNPLQPAITIPVDALSVTVGSDGTVSVTQPGQTAATQVGAIQTAMFINPGGLNAAGNNIYLPTTASGQPVVGTPGGSEGLGSIQQGMLEQSNVSVVNQFVAMILAQRSYESNSRVVKAADEMLQQLNQLAQ